MSDQGFRRLSAWPCPRLPWAFARASHFVLVSYGAEPPYGFCHSSPPRKLSTSLWPLFSRGRVRGLAALGGRRQQTRASIRLRARPPPTSWWSRWTRWSSSSSFGATGYIMSWSADNSTAFRLWTKRKYFCAFSNKKKHLSCLYLICGSNAIVTGWCIIGSDLNIRVITFYVVNFVNLTERSSGSVQTFFRVR